MLFCPAVAVTFPLSVTLPPITEPEGKPTEIVHGPNDCPVETVTVKSYEPLATQAPQLPRVSVLATHVVVPAKTTCVELLHDAPSVTLEYVVALFVQGTAFAGVVQMFTCALTTVEIVPGEMIDDVIG